MFREAKFGLAGVLAGSLIAVLTANSVAADPVFDAPHDLPSQPQCLCTAPEDPRGSFPLGRCYSNTPGKSCGLATACQLGGQGQAVWPNKPI